jgi:hypothetical protein
MATKNQAIVNIAKNWKLEAKLEDNLKYFYHYKEVNMILSNQKCYVIGRKGAGKSAICEYIVKNRSFDSFAIKLNFKNFPFNELYSLQNEKYTQPNQYITLWKYLIYSNICKMMVENENVDSTVRTELEKLYPRNSLKLLSRVISEWTSREFGLSVLGNGGSIKVERSIDTNPISWIEKVNILEDIIQQYCDNSKYYIVFDELDEDYRNVQNRNENQQYINLLTSLFKAVQDVKATFATLHPNIMPIVFLRDDIYTLINDADKNKWSDLKLEIDWSAEKMKDLLAYRISRDTNYKGETPSFGKTWEVIFDSRPIHYGDSQSKTMSSYEFITRSTQLRPRDYIQYIQCCCEHTIDIGANRIDEKTIKFVDRAFSNYLKNEIIDEIFPIIPDIEYVFLVISNIHKQVFTYQEFEAEYKKYLDNGTIQDGNIDYVLDMLFNFSVIGNEDKFRKDRHYFKYLHTNMTYNKDEKMVLHRGLFKALQIL